jgi:hypothetical protein
VGVGAALSKELYKNHQNVWKIFNVVIDWLKKRHLGIFRRISKLMARMKVQECSSE